MRTTKFYFLTCVLLALVQMGCSEDDDTTPTETPSSEVSDQYIITATPEETQGVADYLLTSETLSEGKVSIIGNGIEQEGAYRYYVSNNNKFYSLLYSSEGEVTTYALNASGELTRVANFQSQRAHAFIPVDDDVLITNISRNIESPQAQWFILDTEESLLKNQGQISQDILDNGELATFTWMTQVGDKIFAPIQSTKSCCDDGFGTIYPDQSWVAVYSYPEMELETIIEDDRTSFIGRYFTNGLSVDENGDAYAFSGATAANNNVFNSTKPSAITRINNGELVFDKDYYYNLEEASNGYYVTAHQYASNGNFLLIMQDVDEKGLWTTGNRLAVVNVYDKTFTWVSGMPEADNITALTRNNYTDDDGNTVHVGVNTVNGNFIYNVDVANATANQGIEVEGGNITSITKIGYSEE